MFNLEKLKVLKKRKLQLLSRCEEHACFESVLKKMLAFVLDTTEDQYSIRLIFYCPIFHAS
jgi:hypothetical protein